MSDDSSNEIDFADEMQQLANQASQPKAQSLAGMKADKAELLQSIGEMVRPLALDLDGIKRASADNNLLLTALGKSMNAQRAMPQSLETIAQQMQRLNSVESANQKLFDALHAELKGYKDNFLFDALQKPFIRDLVMLFDDLTSLHTQTEDRLKIVRVEGADEYSAERTFLEQMAGNLENQAHHLLEVFLRMEVTVAQSPVGAPVDKRTHRPISFVAAVSAQEDATVARSARPGFIWRERVVRPEDVVARRWTPPPAAEPTPPAPLQQAPQPADVPASPRQTPIFSHQNAPETVVIPQTLPPLKLPSSGEKPRKDPNA